MTSCSLEKLKPIIYDEENWRYLAVGKSASALRIASAALIVAGIVGLKLAAK